MYLQIALILLQHYTFRLLLSTRHLCDSISASVDAKSDNWSDHFLIRIMYASQNSFRLTLTNRMCIYWLLFALDLRCRLDLLHYHLLHDSRTFPRFANVIPFQSSCTEISWICCSSHRHLPNIQPRVWQCDVWYLCEMDMEEAIICGQDGIHDFFAALICIHPIGLRKLICVQHKKTKIICVFVRMNCRKLCLNWKECSSCIMVHWSCTTSPLRCLAQWDSWSLFLF